MSDYKSFSVLLSVYKNEKAEYLKEAIDSIIDQTIKPSEIILVEDGELTEELYLIIDEYRSRYGVLLKIIKLEHNMGLGIALAKGLEHCSNNIVARMDTTILL